MMHRFVLGTLGVGALALAAAGVSNSAQVRSTARFFRPQPQATTVVGNSAGPLFYVENDGTTPLDTFGIMGAVGGGPGAIAVIGYGTNAAQGNIGTLGYDVGPGAIAGAGYASYPTQSSTSVANQTVGLEGVAPNGNGVVGETGVVSSSATYAGVMGIDTTTNGGSNDGVLGITNNGGFGVEGIASAFTSAGGGVHGKSAYSIGVKGESSTNYGVWGSSSNGVGVIAESSSNIALIAETVSGANGIAGASSTGTGVWGSGAVGGVYGEAVGASAIGVRGFSDATSGVGAGVYGQGTVGTLGTGTSEGIEADCSVTACRPIVANNNTGANVFYVDNSGNVGYHGTLNSFVSTRGGSVARTYTPTTTMRITEDFGSGQLANGVGVVQIDPVFAQTIDGGSYQVFLTPQGDNHGLYVAQKTPLSFVVRESLGGRSSIGFDYRVVAKQLGGAGDRIAIRHSIEDFSPNSRRGAFLAPAPPSAKLPSLQTKASAKSRTFPTAQTIPNVANALKTFRQ